jgi:hypothetical protein
VRDGLQHFHDGIRWDSLSLLACQPIAQAVGK